MLLIRRLALLIGLLVIPLVVTADNVLEELLVIEAHSETVFAIAYSPDGAQIASASIDGTAKVFNTETGELEFVLTGHDNELRDIAFSPDGSLIATASLDGSVILWNNIRGTEWKSLRGGKDGFLTVAFSPDGTTVAAGGYDNIIYVWDIILGFGIANLEEHKDDILQVQFSPTGEDIVSASSDGSVLLWDWRQPTAPILVAGGDKDSGVLWSTTINYEGTQIASAYDDGFVSLWNVVDGTDSFLEPAKLNPVFDLAYSVDNEYLVTVGCWERSRRLCLSGEVHLWNAPDEEDLQVTTAHTGAIWDVVFSPDGEHFATAGGDGTIIIWDISTDD